MSTTPFWSKKKIIKNMSHTMSQIINFPEWIMHKLITKYRKHPIICADSNILINEYMPKDIVKETANK